MKRMLKTRNFVASLIIAPFITLTGVGAETKKNITGSSAISFAGNYLGTEILEGNTFRIKVRIEGNGRITIIDVDNIRGSSKMKGNSFRIRRPRPYQVFEGRIEGNTITGVTYGNRILGDGTFSAVKKE